MFKTLEERPFKVLGMGEVMLRLSPVGKERISYSETFEKVAGGSELNVVSGISMLGLRTGVITKLPHNEIGKFIKLCAEQLGNAHFSFGQRSGFVGEENVHTAGRLDANGLANEHVVSEHTLYV